MNYIVLPTQFTVMPENNPLYATEVTTVTVVDEGAGAFLSIRQTNEDLGAGEIRLEDIDWPSFCQAVDDGLAVCKIINRGEGEIA
jgi:hypothetical protein